MRVFCCLIEYIKISFGYLAFLTRPSRIFTLLKQSSFLHQHQLYSEVGRITNTIVPSDLPGDLWKDRTSPDSFIAMHIVQFGPLSERRPREQARNPQLN